MPSLIAAFKGSRKTSWELLREGLDVWAQLGWDKDFSFNVGDKSGTIFTYTKGREHPKACVGIGGGNSGSMGSRARRCSRSRRRVKKKGRGSTANRIWWLARIGQAVAGGNMCVRLHVLRFRSCNAH